MKRTAREIVEELEGLRQAWPTAPQELWDSLREELIEAAEQSAQEHAPRPLETRRGRTPTKYRRSTCR